MGINPAIIISEVFQLAPGFCQVTGFQTGLEFLALELLQGLAASASAEFQNEERRWRCASVRSFEPNVTAQSLVLSFA
jgi:hypothetical protein